jgi:hypothetical protein
MELTWVAVGASLAMGLAAVCIFIYAVKKDYFRNIEDAKYQVFWSDLEELVDSPGEHASDRKNSPARSDRVNGETDHADPGKKSS